MSEPDFDPFDPISAAMGAMHGQNLLAAKDARIKQLEAELKEMTQIQKETQEDRNEIEKAYWELRDKLLYAGNELARVMEDILGSDMITCQISRAVMTASLAKWQKAKTGQ